MRKRCGPPSLLSLLHSFPPSLPSSLPPSRSSAPLPPPLLLLHPSIARSLPLAPDKCSRRTTQRSATAPDVDNVSYIARPQQLMLLAKLFI
eukprot:1861409-Rhodomonas_salina.1